MRNLFVVVGIVMLWMGHPRRAMAQVRDTVPDRTLADSTSVRVPPACCSIVRIDQQRSVITAREMATGFTFRFAVKTRRLLGTLKVGQPVWADFASKTVRLKATDAQPCCAIVTQETP